MDHNAYGFMWIIIPGVLGYCSFTFQHNLVCSVTVLSLVRAGLLVGCGLGFFLFRFDGLAFQKQTVT